MNTYTLNIMTFMTQKQQKNSSFTSYLFSDDMMTLRHLDRLKRETVYAVGQNGEILKQNPFVRHFLLHPTKKVDTGIFRKNACLEDIALKLKEKIKKRWR